MNKNKYSSLKNMGPALLLKRSGAELEKNIKIKNKKEAKSVHKINYAVARRTGFTLNFSLGFWTQSKGQEMQPTFFKLSVLIRVICVHDVLKNYTRSSLLSSFIQLRYSKHSYQVLDILNIVFVVNSHFTLFLVCVSVAERMGKIWNYNFGIHATECFST